MESITLETKYHNLATEYSKLRANATVLKKAVLDEQARSRELKDTLKEHEQRLRKSNQEMESLTFRNQQLTKRISVLQDELNVKNNTKRNRGKSSENPPTVPANVTLFDEELQKKIMDNAHLISAMADKDLEIANLNDRLTELEASIEHEQKQKTDLEHTHKRQLKELKHTHSQQIKEYESRFTPIAGGDCAKQNGDIHSDKESVISSDDGHIPSTPTTKQYSQLEQEKERWKTEYELLLAMHCEEVSNSECEITSDREQRIKDFFYQRIDELVGDKQEVQSIADSLAAECNALQIRLELSLDEKNDMELKLGKSIDDISRLQEELNTTSHNYDQQLSTMSEHLADLNDKYTEQCELIQQLHYQLGMKGKKK